MKGMGYNMKQRKLAILLAIAMVTSSVTAPMETVYAANDLQIQGEEFTDSAAEVEEENTDIPQFSKRHEEAPLKKENPYEREKETPKDSGVININRWTDLKNQLNLRSGNSSDYTTPSILRMKNDDE